MLLYGFNSIRHWLINNTIFEIRGVSKTFCNIVTWENLTRTLAIITDLDKCRLYRLILAYNICLAYSAILQCVHESVQYFAALKR